MAMERATPFAGVRPVLHVPFLADPLQQVDHEALVRLVSRMVASGVDGLVVLGLASEAWAVTEGERDAVLRTVTAATAGGCPVVVGIDGATRIAVDRARRAVEQGAAGLMVLPPAQAGARGPDGVVEHYRSIARAAAVPILVQDSPQVTGVTLDRATIVRLAEDRLVRSVKAEGPGAGPKVSALVEDGVEVVAGWGGLHYLESVRRGATGCMPGCDLGPAMLRIDRLARSGSLDTAEELYRRVLPLLSYEAGSLELLVLGAKRLLVRQGVFMSGSMRAPARDLDAQERATFDALFERLEREGVPGFVPASA